MYLVENYIVIFQAAFKEWDEIKALIDDGLLKRSTLEKAIVKVGSYDSGEMNYDQFKGVLDAVEENVDASSLSIDEEEFNDEERGSNIQPTIPVGQRSKVLAIKDEEEVSNTLIDDLADDDSENEEEMLLEMREIFNELRGAKEQNLPVVKFLEWDEMQSLLESGAITADNLATCIEKVGIVVDNKGRANQDLNFEMFSDLVSIIEDYIDKDKLVDSQGIFVFLFSMLLY